MYYSTYKAIAVLKSCKTPEQLKVANKFASLAVSRIVKDTMRLSPCSPHSMTARIEAGTEIDSIRNTQLAAAEAMRHEERDRVLY